VNLLPPSAHKSAPVNAGGMRAVHTGTAVVRARCIAYGRPTTLQPRFFSRVGDGVARTLDDYLHDSKRANNLEVVGARAVFDRAIEAVTSMDQPSSQEPTDESDPTR
jgi:hypothetical protein